MEVVTLIDDEYVGLWYHPDGNVVHHKIRKFLPKGVFEKMLTTGAEAFETHRASKWLSDDRDSIVVATEDIEWADAEWSPRVIRAGFKHWAIVAPSKAVAALQMRGLVSQYRERGVAVELFESVESALDWLRRA